jgi:outer membrane protein assembly factor BamA
MIDENAAKDYYYVRMSQFSVSSSIYRQFGTKHTISFGSEFQAINLKENEGRYVETKDAELDSSVYGKKKYANFQLTYEFNTIDNALFPRNGFKFYAGGKFTQNIDDKDKNFVSLFSEASLFASAGRFTLATRSGASTNVGDDYEFFQAHTIGGLNYLRGYHKDRYSGKTSVYQNTELRFSISNVNMYITKGAWGLLAFADHGRVWIKGEESNTWHHGYGGGIWLLPFNKMALTATYGVSKEDKLISIKAGFQL